MTLSDYSGISYDNAVSRLIALGIPESQIKRVDEESDKVEKDTVISQEPASGTAVDPKNDTITLHVSKGSDSVTVPDISGYSPKAAEDSINNAGLKINEQGLSGSGDGQVVERTSPSAGSKVKKATLLQFIIQKQMIQKAPLVKVVRVIKTRGWDRSV